MLNPTRGLAMVRDAFAISFVLNLYHMTFNKTWNLLIGIGLARVNEMSMIAKESRRDFHVRTHSFEFPLRLMI